MSESQRWSPPDPLVDFHDIPLPDDPDPDRSFDIVGPAACRRSDGTELYLSAGESELLSRLKTATVTMEGISSELRHVNRLALAGLIDITYGDRISMRIHPQASVHDLREHTTDQVLPPRQSRTRQQMYFDLQRENYVFTNDAELGLSQPTLNAADHTRAKYFDSLQNYPGDVPDGRKRMTGLICAHWILGGISFDEDGAQQPLEHKLVLQQSPHSTVPVFDDDNIAERPEYVWHDMLRDPVLSRLYGEAMFMVPPESRALSTTLGTQIFETFGDVVTRPHNDGGVINMLYCVYTNGGTDGAWTYVLAPDGTTVEGDIIYKECPLFIVRLEEGMILIIADDKVGHYSIPNTPRFIGDKPSRGMVVVTVNRGKTYEEQLRYPYYDLADRYRIR